MTKERFDLLLIGMVALAAVVFAALYFVRAGYGLLRDGRWGPKIDNRIGWINWKNGKEGQELLEFVKQAIQFRKEHPVLHGSREPRLMDYKGVGCPDLSYHSQRAWFSQMENTCRFIGVMYCGDYAEKENGETDDYLYVGFNMHWNSHELALPSLPEKCIWRKVADTSLEKSFLGDEAEVVEGKSIVVSPRSAVILVGRQE